MSRYLDMARAAAIVGSLSLAGCGRGFRFYDNGYAAGYAAACDSIGSVRTRCDSLMDSPGALAARALDAYGVRYVILTYGKSGSVIRRYNFDVPLTEDTPR